MDLIMQNVSKLIKNTHTIRPVCFTKKQRNTSYMMDGWLNRWKVIKICLLMYILKCQEISVIFVYNFILCDWLRI